MKLSNRLYDAIVISDEVDRTLSGAVRISIIGITDNIEDDFQPLALPAVDASMGVPTKGTYLKVYFEDGDIHQPIYLQSSPQKSYLPEEYINNYPNVSVSNLGSDFFQMTHNRAERRTIIDHDSESSLTWDAFGALTHDSDKAYENTGRGAKNGNGQKIQPVLTEGTINPFTARPMFGGSEYLKVSHISKSTVTGSIEAQQKLAEVTPISETETGFDEPITRPLLTGTVEYLQAKNILNIPDRKIKIILIGNTGNNDFSSSVNTLLNSQISSHYVVGRLQKDIIQMIDLDKAGTFGSKGTWNKESAINKIAVSIMLCGDGKVEYTSDQYINMNLIIQHVRQLYGNSVEIVTISDVDPLMVNIFGTSFNRSRLVS